MYVRKRRTCYCSELPAGGGLVNENVNIRTSAAGTSRCGAANSSQVRVPGRVSAAVQQDGAQRRQRDGLCPSGTPGSCCLAGRHLRWGSLRAPLGRDGGWVCALETCFSFPTHGAAWAAAPASSQGSGQESSEQSAICRSCDEGTAAASGSKRSGSGFPSALCSE